MKQLIVDRHTTPGTPTLEEVPTEKVPVYDSVSDAEADFANLEVGQIVATKEPEKSLLDFLYPIGVTYVQYPQQKSPNELWPNMTWTKLDYAGAFFRADGGPAAGYATCADTLSCCIQRQQAPKITGISAPILNPEACNAGAFHPAKSSCFLVANGSYYRFAWGQSCFDSSWSGASTNNRGSNIYAANGELRPENYTVQIWVRTA